VLAAFGCGGGTAAGPAARNAPVATAARPKQPESAPAPSTGRLPDVEQWVNVPWELDRYEEDGRRVTWKGAERFRLMYGAASVVDREGLFAYVEDGCKYATLVELAGSRVTPTEPLLIGAFWDCPLYAKRLVEGPHSLAIDGARLTVHAAGRVARFRTRFNGPIRSSEVVGAWDPTWSSNEADLAVIQKLGPVLALEQDRTFELRWACGYGSRSPGPQYCNSIRGTYALSPDHTEISWTAFASAYAVPTPLPWKQGSLNRDLDFARALTHTDRVQASGGALQLSSSATGQSYRLERRPDELPAELMTSRR
jgi:hypothetical protein